jgi:hypothetical protein
MPRGNYRRPYKPPFDASITQAVEVALRDAGRDDVVDLMRKSGMRELEHDLHKAKERIHALELEKVNWMTESGMFRALDARAGKVVVGWGKKALNAAMAAAGLGIVSLLIWAGKLAWKSYTHK